jgi:hypothetical protein
MKQSTRYRETILMLNRTLTLMSEDKTVLNEERRRLLLIKEFMYIVYQSNSINYDRCNLFMRIDFEKKKDNTIN